MVVDQNFWVKPHFQSNSVSMAKLLQQNGMCFSPFQMDFSAKCYPCYFDAATLVSLKDKQVTNLRMETTILEMLNDIQSRQSYLHKYWYNLKYFVQALHGVYQLLYKILVVYGNSSMRTKLKCHDLIKGPRTI